MAAVLEGRRQCSNGKEEPERNSTEPTLRMDCGPCTAASSSLAIFEWSLLTCLSFSFSTCKMAEN